MLGYLALLVALGAAVPKGTDLDETYTFEMYNVEFKKSYRPGTKAWREAEAVFLQRRDDAIAHNRQGHSWVKAINKFSDWTDEDLKSMRGYKHTTVRPTDVVFEGTADFQAPANIDWRNKNVLTPIKNQGQCGSCWAFAATESIESSAAVASSQTPKALAVEQIVECTPNPEQCGGTGGCNGATAELAYRYAMSVPGITTEALYPYSSGNGTSGNCNWTERQYPAVVSVSGYTRTPRNNRMAAIEMLAQGPVALAVEASSWMTYGGGVFDGCNKEATLTIDHGVQLVGMATDSSGNVSWIVRNSWGADWGENGFIRLADTNACVVDPAPGDGIGCPNGPPQVLVCGPCALFYDVSRPFAAPISA